MSEDHDLLQVLAFFHWALAAFAAFVALIPAIYLALAWGLRIDPLAGNAQFAASHTPELVPSLIAAAATAAALLAAAGLGFAARGLQRRRGLLLCRAMAGVGCLFVPFGTLLGIYTLLTLARPEIATCFARGRGAADPVRAPG